MHAFVAGASGQTGTLIISNLVEAGHTVTALARNPDALPARPGVTVVKGTPENKEDIAKCFATAAPDVVFVSLASSTNAPNGAFLTYCVTNIVEVMEEHKTPKIVYMSAFGVDDSFPGLNMMMKFVVEHTKLKREFKDHRGAEQILKQIKTPGINWTVVRPAMLKNGPAKPTKAVGDQGQDRADFMPSVTRASVAQFMVEVAQSNERDGHTPVICNDFQ